LRADEACQGADVPGTITPQNVVATDGEGNLYSVRGALWFGGAVNAQQENFVFTDTAKLQLVSQGSGSVDSVNLTSHVTLVNGNVKEFDRRFVGGIRPAAPSGPWSRHRA
jgi:hypothetical protein